jgi:hypothetical protein
MAKRMKLYVTLLEMLDAAEAHSQEKVVSLNAMFSPEYAKIMPTHYTQGSLPDLYDRARHKFINSVDDIVAPTSDKKSRA